MSTRTEAVISLLRQRILDGKFAPGARLLEIELAKGLGVSRTPVRDALRVLAAEELLNYVPNRGYSVPPLSLKDILDAYDARGTLEGMACRLVAEEGLAPPMLVKLEEILQRSEDVLHSEAWGEHEQAEWRRLNTAFHLVLVDCAKNHHLATIARHLRRLPSLYDRRLEPHADFYQQVYKRERRQQSHREHGEIFDAIQRRQSARAENLMREHVYRNREVLRAQMEVIKGFARPVAADLDQTHMRRE